MEGQPPQRVKQDLQKENQRLKARLAEAEETLEAIHHGEVDAVVVAGPSGPQIYTLQGADKPHRLLLEAMQEGAMTLLLDGIVLYCNSRLAEMVKRPIEQVIGSAWQRLFPVKEQAVFQKFISEANHGKHGKSKGESALRTCDDVVLPVQVSVSSTDLDGVKAMAVLLTDISARKSAEEALLRAKEDLELRVQERTRQLQEANAVLHEQKEVLATANQELQAKAREIQRQSEALASAKEQLRRYAENLERAVQERTAELKELVDELEHFSYTITHDMRAPLRAMHGLSKMLVNECGQCQEAERRDFLRRIADAATRMDSLITDALSYNKAVREKLVLEPVDVKELLMGILESYPEFHPHKADIKIEGDMPLVQGNKAGLTQCFSNLLSNAVKFVEPGKVAQIRIWAEPKGEYVRLNFQDNGIGIPQQYQEQVWGMFQKLSNDYEGTGIGLALVRKVMTRMGGRVGLKSEPGKGSCFWLELKRHA